VSTEELAIETQETIYLRNNLRNKFLKFIETEENIQEKLTEKIPEDKVIDSEKIIQIVFNEILEKIIWTAFSKIEEKIHPQVIAIFLFNKKDGCTKRSKIWGMDMNSQLIEDSWLKDESYAEGQGFSGMTLEKPFGKPYYCNNLDQPDIISNLKFGQHYKEKLGFLKCGISVPLYSTHRVFGLIRIFNKVDSETGKPNNALEFTQSEIFWLTILGGHLSDAISRLRRKQEDRIRAELIRMTKTTGIQEVDVYSFITRQLIGELTPYKVCVLRIRHGDNFFITEFAATTDIKISGKGNTPRKIQERGIVGEVARSKKYVKIEDINQEEERFISFSWIRDNRLRSFICFPLEFQGDVIGTISLFTGYLHVFNDSDIDFLRQVSDLLSTYVGIVRLQSDQKEPTHSIAFQAEFERKSISVRNPFTTKELILDDKEPNSILEDLKKEFESIEEEEYHKSYREVGQIYNAQEWSKTLSDKMEQSFRKKPTQSISKVDIQILKAIKRYRLSIQDLVHTIGLSEERIKKIIQKLWVNGYIDYLSSPMIFTLFPGLRNHYYRQQSVEPLAPLTLTSKGYFRLNPVVQFNKPLMYA
jgi:GAF domain-containing protein